MVKAIVSLSGGLDSATAMAVARSRGRACQVLSFRYGQRHDVELLAAKRVAKALGAEDHRVITIDAGALSGSALTPGSEISVPKGRTEAEIGQGIPSTYVPGRNTLFLAHALAVAESTGAEEIYLGINVLDYSGYPDCRPEWLAAMQEVARVGTRSGVEGHPVKIEAPLLNMTKADIIKLGVKLGLDYSLTHSCYDPSPTGLACGGCDACALRKRGFAEAGVPDPTHYR